MKRRVLVAALAGVLGLLLLGGAGSCESQHPSGPPPAEQNPAVNQPGPQADPGTCVQRPGKRDIELHVSWVSEKSEPPVITWAYNGVATPATNVRRGEQTGGRGKYEGEWSTLVQAQCGDTVSVRSAGTRSQTLGTCSIIDLGQGPVKIGNPCEAHYVVP